MPQMNQLSQLERRVEAMLFASGHPLEGEKIADILEIEKSTVHQLVQRIKDRYAEQQSPINILFLDGSYQMSSYPEYAEDIQSAIKAGRGGTLSTAALEALAVIAYNQPVTRAFVEEVRGVDCSNLIRNLAEKDLVEESGRMAIPGNPILYVTTTTFLRSFGLDSLDQLPTLPTPQDDGNLEEENLEVEGQIDTFGSGEHAL